MRVLRAVAAATFSLVGAVGLATLAHADGMPRDRYVPVYDAPVFQTFDWSGIYIGGHVGAAHVGAEWTFTGPTERVDQGQTSFAGGGQVGIQKQWGRAVLGVEVSYTWLDAEQTSGSIAAPGTSLSSDMTNLVLVAGRLGYAQDRMLFYAKGGYATADVDFRSSVTGTGVVTTTSSGREHGWVAGIGLDYAVTDHISLGVEYDYVRLNVGGRDQIPTPAGAAGSTVIGGGFDTQMVIGRLSFKLGPGARPEAVPAR